MKDTMITLNLRNRRAWIAGVTSHMVRRYVRLRWTDMDADTLSGRVMCSGVELRCTPHIVCVSASPRRYVEP